jgi:alpha-mannosidase
VTADLNPAFQGCFSARIDIKQWNRKLETVLSNSEKYDALAQRLGANGREEQIDAAWQGVLFNQFHDIICGSHVDAVFHNTMDRFKSSLDLAGKGLNSSLETIAGRIDTRGEGAPVVVFNPLGWERSDVVECCVAYSEPVNFELAVLDSSGSQVPSDLLSVERNPNGSIARARLLFIASHVPCFGYETYHILPASGQTAAPGLASSHPYGGLLRFELDRGWMENEFYKLEFNLWTGVITSIFDKVGGWEILAEDKRYGNTVVKERDFGNFWQYNGPCKGDEFYPIDGLYPLPEQNDPAVDFAHTYLGDGNIHQGNAMVEFTINHPYGSGHYATRVRMYAGLPRIDIQTTLVNNDERVRYRAAFPTSIRGGKITYEIPFGAIERPEGEFPAQNWIDYSSGEHGVTLLNLGLPGNNVVDGVLLLSLLKCTALKEGYAEVGGFKLSTPTEEGYEKGKTHVFDYALVPHRGGWRAVEAYRRGMEFNSPLIVQKPARQSGSLASKMSFIQWEGENVVLSAVRAVPGGMIVRVYEAKGEPALGANLIPTWPVQQAFEVNLLEKDAKSLPMDFPNNRLVFNLSPFEIKTFKFIF